MFLVYIGVALWVGVIVIRVGGWLIAWWDRPIAVTEWADARRDEMAARKAVRPYGNVDLLCVPESWVLDAAFRDAALNEDGQGR